MPTELNRPRSEVARAGACVADRSPAPIPRPPRTRFTAGRRALAGRARGVAVLGILCTAAWLAISGSVAHAQLLRRATVIQGARVWTGTGFVLAEGSLVMKGDAITALGAQVKPPMLARIVDARGKFVTPGLIDVQSALGVTRLSGAAGATHSAADAFDRYASKEIRAALAQGVTSAYLGPGRGPGVRGTGALVRLHPHGAASGAVETRDVDLVVDLGSEQGAVARVRTFAAIRDQFEKAKRYRRSVEDYEADLEEYEKKLAEYAEKKKAEKAQQDGDEQDAAKSGGGAGAGEKKAKGRAGARGHRDAKRSGRRGRRGRGARAAGPPLAGKPAGAAAKAAGKGKGKKDEGPPKKPRRPKRSPASEVLLRAIDREIPVRVTADRSSDILNALELAEEFDLELILEGAAEAYLVAEQLAEADVTVVLGELAPGERRRPGPGRRVRDDAGRILREAGVKLFVGSGAQPGSARFVALNAQLAAARGALRDPLRAVTARAARLLRAEGLGVLRRGAKADVVVWSGDPLLPDSVVERVYVGGELAYERGEEVAR